MIFSINGAFVPSCSKNHVPGYAELAQEQELKKQGISVMAESGKIQNTDGKIRFLGDPCGNFAKKKYLMLEKFTDIVGTVRNQ